MQVASILAGKGSNVATILPDASVADAVEQLRSLGVGALVVSTDGRTVTGIVSERDVVRRLASDAAGVLSLPVHAVMTTAVHTCGPDDAVERLMVMMTEHRIRHVPVVVDGELAGIVSIGDVVKGRLGQLERENQALYEYFTGTR
jgi:CBS domain-containing protein